MCTGCFHPVHMFIHKMTIVDVSKCVDSGRLTIRPSDSARPTFDEAHP